MESFGHWASKLRLVPSLAIAGATVAILVLFVRYTPEILGPGEAPAPSTGSSADDVVILASQSGSGLMATAGVTEGIATILRADGTSEDLVQGNTAEIAVGDSLLTLDGTIRLSYFENQWSIIQSTARVKLLELDAENGGTQMTLEVQLGYTRHSIVGPLGTNDRFEIRDAASKASAVGTEFVVDVKSKTETYYATYEGSVLVGRGEEEESQ